METLKNAIESNRWLEDLWRAFLNCSQFGVFWKDKERRFLGCNQFFLDYYGFRDLSAILGKTDEDMGWHIHPEKFQSDEWKIIHDGTITVNVPGTCISRGRVRDIAATKFPVRDGEGRIVGLMGFFRDVQGGSLSKSDQDLLARLSRADELSGLQNSIGKQFDYLDYEDEYRLKGTDFAEINISIRNFETLERENGNRFGEKLIKAVARHLVGICGQAASISRIVGGDFAILKQCQGTEEIEEIVRRIKEEGELPEEVLLGVDYSLFSRRDSSKASISAASDKAMTEKIVQRMLGLQFECMAVINAHTQMMYYHYFGTSIPASRWRRYGDVASGVTYDHVMKVASEQWAAPEDRERMYSLTRPGVLLEQMEQHEQYIVKVKVNSSEPEGEPMWKQMRYSWLDDAHEWILYDQTDVTESMRLEQAHLAETNEARTKLAREHERAVWAHVKAEILMQIPGTLSFDYNPDTDILELDICRRDGTMERRQAEGYLRGGHPVGWLDASSREIHAREWQLAMQEARLGSYDVALRLTDDKLEWYKVTYRSVAGRDGKVFRVVGRAESVQNYISTVDEWRERATRDSLTGLLNHSCTLDMIEQELSGSKVGTLIMIDVDKFKTLNDSFGHLYGDYVLIEVAKCIRSVFREADIVGRYGGDEFIAFMRGFHKRSVVEKKLQRINETVRSLGKEKGAYVASSIGAILDVGGDVKELVAKADEALYIVKQKGGNGYNIVGPEEG